MFSSPEGGGVHRHPSQNPSQNPSHGAVNGDQWHQPQVETSVLVNFDDDAHWATAPLQQVQQVQPMSRLSGEWVALIGASVVVGAIALVGGLMMLTSDQGTDVSNSESAALVGAVANKGGEPSGNASERASGTAGADTNGFSSGKDPSKKPVKVIPSTVPDKRGPTTVVSTTSTTAVPTTVGPTTSTTAAPTTIAPTTVVSTTTTTAPTTVAPTTVVSTTTTAAPTTTTTAAPTTVAGDTLAAFRQELLTITNAERAKVGCPALVLHPILNDVAQAHSEDMIARNYFAHSSPDGVRAGQRMTNAGYDWMRWGENIAYGYPTPANVMNGWMNSPSHRGNILDCNFKEMGVGYANPNHYWTQVFGTR